jgi:hypothetical protein
MTVSPTRSRGLSTIATFERVSSSAGMERVGSIGGRDRGGVKGLWADAAYKLLVSVFEAKCVDLKLKPLKERRDRFLHKARVF